MHVPIPLTKLSFEGNGKVSIPKITCKREKYDLWRNYYFGIDGIDMSSAQDSSFYRGTFPDQVITTLS